MSIFKAYDIRGVYPDELNEEIAEKTARAFAQMRKKETNKSEIRLVLARDMRLSSPSLYESAKKGLLAEGVTVVEIGLASTPVFYFAVSFYGYDGGLIISASHNPKQDNGIKIVRDRALPFGQGMGMEELSDLVLNSDFGTTSLEGKVEGLEGVMDEYIKNEVVGLDLSKIKNMKVVVDTANSMGATYLDPLFKLLPQVDIVKMNYELDGSFPAHEANPYKDENIVDLQEKVREVGAFLGIATDGDGDRVFFVDETGERIEPAIVRGILAECYLKDNPGAKICYDIRPGKITPDMILAAGGEPVMTKVGHSFIKQKMLETGAVFGGESSGHFFVKFPHGIYEAPVAVIARLLLVLSESGKKCSEFVAPLKKYAHSGEINFHVEDKAAVLQKIKEKYSDAEINDMDGFTFTYPDVWFNTRVSNTEPVLRLNVEGNNREVVKRVVSEISKIIEE